ncbi:hypothetical protein [Desulfocurvibacter africanus]|uniref:hypothetical protein n=1 Tax=Desulfocurvibacter africanus TaxID=873 RepID=UPI00110C40A6|nr:hypothetical protein [Desulfocurvibacter africanus]
MRLRLSASKVTRKITESASLCRGQASRGGPESIDKARVKGIDWQRLIRESIFAGNFVAGRSRIAFFGMPGMPK